ncbi:MAG TPA: hypothetical protein VNW15_12680 [Rhizomicrobium sp.]|jgi:hypothetical protein|nr:hypothetical protein [Rhizomicrobium sp.]
MTHMMRFTHPSVAVAIALVCFGCQNGRFDIVPSQEAYKVAIACCSNFQELTYTKLATGRATGVTIMASDQAYAFSTGISYFKAFELPTLQPKSEIVIESAEVISPGVGTFFFYPLVTFLDNSKQVIATVNQPAQIPVLPASNHLGMTQSTIEFHIALDDYLAARYVIIHTAASLVGAPHQVIYHNDAQLSPLVPPIVSILDAAKGPDLTTTIPGSPVAPASVLQIEIRKSTAK